ncbi:MAG: bifunctional precorrin-2 dehydrogenase/sirohydrochlorin ferrochelatase [Desulfuromonadales bacterium]|nr:bifunctional precorrin-2 dehydrogenase/sirohydrochlorin ferrochelatase [Desulfuromonadales bacterium]
MSDFPVFFRLQGRLCVVVGSGAVGRRKALAVTQAGGRVRLISPQPLEGEWPAVEHRLRPYQPGDLAGAFLAFAATGDPQTDAAVLAEARQERIPIDLASAPAGGDFSLPAQFRRGDLTVAVSTAGRSPALAAAVRDQLAEAIGPEWAIMVEIAAALRRKKLTDPPEAEYNRKILSSLLAAGLLPLLVAGATSEIDRLLTGAGGEGCTLAALGICLPKGKT